MRKLFAICAVAFGGLFAAHAALAQGTIAFASLPQGTINYFQSSALAKVIQEHSNLQMRVIPLRSGALALSAVNAGDAEFTLGSAPEAAEALDGAAYFHGQKNPRLRVAFSLRPLTLGMMVRKDSGINTYADLKGKRLPTGWNAFPSSVVYMKAVLKTAGLTLADVEHVPVPGLVRSVDDFKQGKNDGTLVAVEAPMVREADSAVGGLKFLSIRKGPAALAAVQSFNRYFFIKTVKPSAHTVGIVGPTRVLAFDIIITTSTRVPDSVVEKVVQVVHDNRAALIKAHHSFAAFFPKGMAKQYPTLRYHPGAIAYYKKIGLWPKGK